MSDTNQELKNAIVKWQADNNEGSTLEFVAELLKTKLLVPITVDDEDTTLDENNILSLKKGVVVKFESVVNFENDHFFVTFTDIGNMKEWSDSLETIRIVNMGFFEIYSIVMDISADFSGFVINPYGENLTIEKNQLPLISDLMKELIDNATDL